MNEEYQEIDLGELIRVVLKKWWLILLLMIVAGGATYYTTVNYVTPIYEAKATLFIGKESGALSDLDLAGFSLDSKLVIDYKELIKTKLVTREVIDQLALITDEANIVKNLGVEIINESRFMHVTFKDPIPERAELIVNTLAEILADKAQTIIGINNVQIVDYATLPETPISPSVIKNVAVAAVIGMMIALGIIFLQMMMNDTIKSEEDIEKYFGRTVLGVVPKFKGEAR